ncbi:hypothetical protein [Clostridium sp. JNZ J1-5]
MFKKTKLRNSKILFISSYFPLYIIIFVQNVSSLGTKCLEILRSKDIELNKLLRSALLLKKALKGLATYPETYLIIACLVLMFFSFFSVKYMLKDMAEYSESAFKVKILKATSLNYEYVLTYFSIYIFPFITLNLSSFSGIIQFSILWIFIGYVYIKNDLIYINPMLNIIFKYNIYKTTIEFKDGKEIYKEEIILFTKKEKHRLNDRSINVIKENSQFYIEL